MAACDWVFSEYFDWAQQNEGKGPMVGVQVSFPYQPDPSFQTVFVAMGYQRQLSKPGKKLKVGKFEFDTGFTLLPARFNGTQEFFDQPGPGEIVGPSRGSINLQVSSLFARLHVNVKLAIPQWTTEFGFEPTCNPNVLAGWGNPNDARTYCLVRFGWKQLGPK